MRTLPAFTFQVEGIVPDSATDCVDRVAGKALTGECFVKEITVTNIHATDSATLTLSTDGGASVMWMYNMLPGSQAYKQQWEEGWRFNSGIRWQASAASAIRVEIIGRAKP